MELWEVLVRLEKLESDLEHIRELLLEERRVVNIEVDDLVRDIDLLRSDLSALEGNVDNWVKAVFIMVCSCILTALVGLL